MKKRFFKKKNKIKTKIKLTKDLLSGDDGIESSTSNPPRGHLSAYDS